ncbi:MAG TPA: hypothetical protein PLJ47_17155, partial [Candidatus Hydrogenedentes bacterium]|nr:hypothetical protein [Candidatus Hydrogenedentota bacterium]
MYAPFKHLYSSPRDATVACGLIAGFLYSCEASLGRDSLNLCIGIAMTILPFLGPAISLRSPAR